jgi:hypothetical protein
VVAKVIELLTVSKGKWKAVPARAKVYSEVDGLVSHLPQLTSICANIYAYSATDVSHGRHSQSASPHPMSGAARSARWTRAGAPGRRVMKLLRVRLSLPARGLRVVSQADESSSRDEVEVLEVHRGKS